MSEPGAWAHLAGVFGVPVPDAGPIQLPSGPTLECVWVPSSPMQRTGHLLVSPSAPARDLYALVHEHGAGAYTVVGWCSREEVVAQGLGRIGGGELRYIVRRLRHIDLLVKAVADWRQRNPEGQPDSGPVQGTLL